MALSDRLHALGQYLRQCEGEASFPELRRDQFRILCQNFDQQLSSLELVDATTLVGHIQGMPWLPEQRQQLIETIHSRIRASATACSRGGRVILQNFTAFMHYLRSSDWERILDPSQQGLVLTLHLREILRHLAKLTLKHPTEDTWASLTTLLLIHDQARYADPLQLRASYLAVKAQGKLVLNNLPKDEERIQRFPPLTVLPPDPHTLDRRLLDDVFGPGGFPAPVPHQIDVSRLVEIAVSVAKRSPAIIFSTG